MTVTSDLETRLRKIIADKLSIDESKVVIEASFTKDLGADSLDLTELIMDMEDEFGIKISDEDAEKIRTVSDALNYVKEHMQA